MSFVPSSVSIGPPGANRLAWVLHGILGSGRNWRSLARKLSEGHPEWRFLLVDLRHHGRSGHPPSPDTLAACAADLEALAEPQGPPELVVGHSFGGKVALELARRGHLGAVTTWALDAAPGAALGQADAASHDALGVLAALRTVAGPMPDRARFREGLLRAGLSQPIVAWLLTSARRGDDGLWRWVYDLDAVDAMLRDYLATDFWPWLTRTTQTVHLLRAGRGGRWSESDLLAAARLSPESSVRVHLLPEAGHWVHVDDPEGTMALLATSLSA